MDDKWLDDLIEFKEKQRVFEIENERFNQLNTVYKQLFRVYNRSQKFGEEYELVVGVGLLNFKDNDDCPKIFRHIITQKVEIDFKYSLNESQIIVGPNLESSLQIETDSIIDLDEQFDSQDIISSEKNVETYLKERNIDSVFSGIEDALQMFANRVSADGSWENNADKPQKVSKKPKVTFSPALILRKRNTRSFTALYTKIIEDIENDSDDLRIPIFSEIIGEDCESNEQQHTIETRAAANPIIYFPKEYNDEQIEIVTKAQGNNKILVQGPPGTGKSHTIANLICHLLANGKKVLVTAYTKRALEVLHDKLPSEFQDLVVNLLSGDASSIQDLQKSVNAINDELANADHSRYKKKIERLNGELKDTKEKIAKNTSQLLAIREKSTREHEINQNYKGTLTAVAEKIESDNSKFEWYKDDFSDIENSELYDQIDQLIGLQQKYNDLDTAEFNYSIPNLEKLPTVDEFAEYVLINRKLVEEFSDGEGMSIVKYPDLDLLLEKLTSLQNHYSDFFRINIEYKDQIVSEKPHKWRKKIEQSKKILSKIDSHDIYSIDRDVEIVYPKDRSLKQLKKDAQALLEHLSAGNPLSGIAFKLKKSFYPKEVKERLYFIDAVRINGSPCDTEDEFKTVLRDIAFQQDFLELADIWKKPIPNSEQISKRLDFFKEIQRKVIDILDIYEQVNSIKAQIEQDINIEIIPFDNFNLNSSLRNAEYSKLIKRKNEIQRIIDNSKRELLKEKTHPLCSKICTTYDEVEKILYAELLTTLESKSKGQEDYQNFLNLRNSVQVFVPNVVDDIEANSFSSNQISDLKLAVYHKNALKEINKLFDANYEQHLIDDLNTAETKERTLIAKIASKKAWVAILERLSGNRELRTSLIAWAEAVKKIGKTGRGKRALKFRKIAQKQMERCKDSVPCWIMPLYKVAETIKPEQEMFDYVIIDEASQLGPDAIFLLYISKNVIIVGDDKQTSPEYVGVNANAMTPHINRYLEGIPKKDFYGTEFSFFDHAKFFCDGVTVLREHFRCMPEIIEFCNKQFYAPDGKGLYPLKQYSEKRLEPLMSFYCESGYTEGRYSKLINEPEAAMIAQTIKKLAGDKRYKGKSFGVITLQGNQQANLIENLLLKEIGEKEFHARNIVCGKSASFQGDERDIIFLSLVTALNHKRSALVKPEDERRFNVAISRAKEQIWLFHSIQLDDLSNTNDLRYKVLDHFKNYNSYQPILNKPIERRFGTQPEPFESWFEVDVYNDIISKGLSVIPQYEVAKGRYRIDMVALFPNGTKIAIECDGDKWHGAEQYQNDMMRQKVLERCGWQFFRVRGYEYYSNREKALEPLWRRIPKTKPEQPVSHLKNEDSDRNIRKESIAENEIGLQEQSSNIERTSTKNIQNVDSDSSTEGVIRYFNLFRTGTYFMTDANPLEADYVIPIQSSQKSGFLLQCYRSGHINKVYISTLLSKRIGKEYMNGLNKDGELIHIEVVESEKIVGIYFHEKGRKIFKAHLTENISTREQLHLKGYKVIYSKFDRISFKILPLEIHDKIKRLVFQSFTANGKPVDNKYYEAEWSIIKRHSTNHGAKKSQREENIPNSLFDNRVRLNSTVTIKFIRDNKELKVKLIDYITNGAEIIDGVQLVNIMKPLAASIKDKTIGDVVKIGKTNSEVKIIEIR